MFACAKEAFAKWKAANPNGRIRTSKCRRASTDKDSCPFVQFKDLSENQHKCMREAVLASDMCTAASSITTSTRGCTGEF